MEGRKDVFIKATLPTASEIATYKDIIPIDPANNYAWTRSEEPSFGQESRVVSFQTVGGKINICSNPTNAHLGVRPTLLLNNHWTFDKNLKPGDQLEFSGEDKYGKHQEYLFTFLGEGEDNKFIAISDKALDNLPYSEKGGYGTNDYEKSELKRTVEAAGVALKGYDCKVIHKDIDIDKENEPDEELEL